MAGVSAPEANKSNGKKLSVAGQTGPVRLAAFDFDYTMISRNSDSVIAELLPRGTITKAVHALADREGWTKYMAAVFRLLYANGFTKEQLCAAIRVIPEVPGIIKCIRRLSQLNYDVIIISDSNSQFIEEWLQEHNLSDCIKRIFTNPAQFQPDGLLQIEPFHHQTDCNLSASNLCKGRILDRHIMDHYLRNNSKYTQVIYIGDGNNDICPVLRLNGGDIAFARFGFAMANSLERNREKFMLHARLVHWRNGYDLLTRIEEALGTIQK